MAKLTNISGVPRALPMISGRYVEFAVGETQDVPDADYAALADRIDIKNGFAVEGFVAPSELEKTAKTKKITVKDPE